MTVILGGGISGLSAAYYAAKNAKITSVSLLEASNRVGGWIRSRVSPNGAIFEQGPRSIRVPGAGKNTLDLVEDLQLTDKLIGIQYNHLASKNRLIYSNGTLHLLPLEISLKLLFRKIPLLNHSLTKYIWTDLNTPGVSKEDESLHSFFQRRFGQDVADKLISPIVCGVYAGDAREISIKSLFKSLFEIEQKYGSVIKGMVQHRLEMVSGSKGDSTSTQNTSQDESVGSHGALVARLQKEHCALWSLQGGLEQLPQALANHLKEQGVKIETEKKCEKLTFKSDRVELLINGATQGCSHVISSLRAKDLAELVQEQHPILSAELKAIPTVTVAVVNLEFQGDVLPLPAFGFLVPPMENLPLLGVTFDSCIIRQTSSTVLTVMMGGAWFDKYFGADSTDEQLLRTAIDHTRNILRIHEDPIAHNVAVLKDCIPQHVVGHTERVKRIREYISEHRIPLGLCGSSYDGVGVSDVILSAKQAVCGMAK